MKKGLWILLCITIVCNYSLFAQKQKTSKSFFARKMINDHVFRDNGMLYVQDFGIKPFSYYLGVGVFIAYLRRNGGTYIDIYPSYNFNGLLKTTFRFSYSRDDYDGVFTVLNAVQLCVEPITNFKTTNLYIGPGVAWDFDFISLGYSYKFNLFTPQFICPHNFISLTLRPERILGAYDHSRSY